MLKINYSELMLIKETYKTRLLKIIESYNKIILDNQLSKEILIRMIYDYKKEDAEHLINDFNLIFEFENFVELLENIENNKKEHQIYTEYKECFRGQEEYIINYYYIPLSLFNHIEDENYNFRSDLENYLLEKYKDMENEIQEEKSKREAYQKEKENRIKEERYKEYLRLKEEFNTDNQENKHD